MEFKEDLVNLMEEDITLGYSNVQLLYLVNDVVGIEVWARDYERGIEMLKSIVSQLNLDEFKEDEVYWKKYNKAVDISLENEKEQKKVIA